MCTRWINDPPRRGPALADRERRAPGASGQQGESVGADPGHDGQPAGGGGVLTQDGPLVGVDLGDHERVGVLRGVGGLGVEQGPTSEPDERGPGPCLRCRLGAVTAACAAVVPGVLGVRVALMEYGGEAPERDVEEEGEAPGRDRGRL